jgi:hypothetical protein
MGIIPNLAPKENLTAIKHRGLQRYKSFLDEKGRHCWRDMRDRIEFEFHTQRAAYKKLLTLHAAKDFTDLTVEQLPNGKPDPNTVDG